MAELNNFFFDSLFRVQGALLGHIRPECLLDVLEFKQWCSMQVQAFTAYTVIQFWPLKNTYSVSVFEAFV